MEYTTGIRKPFDKNKLTLYVDIDGVVLRTSESFINYYCQKNNINKTFYDLKDYYFRSIDRKINIEEFWDYIESEVFINNVKFFEEFLKYFNQRKDDFNWVFITKGTDKNFKIKEKILCERLSFYNISFIHIKNHEEKSIVDMSDGIQIDDFYCNLSTNAQKKILVKNFIDADFNFVPDIREDLYIMNDWKEIGECLDWFKKEWELEHIDNYI